MAGHPRGGLRPLQQGVFQLKRAGKLSNKEIAAALCLSEGTVRNYISSILRKLELRDRTQLAIWAVQNQNSQPEADV